MATDFYKLGDSILHRFDPRAKLILLAALVVCFFLPFPFWVPLVHVAALSVLIWISLGGKELGKSMAAIAPVLLIICLLTPVFRRGGETLWAPFGFPLVTTLGVIEAFRLVVRFTGLTLVFFAVFRAMDLNDLILALRWFGLPFRASLVMIIVFRFIPSLFLVYQNVQDAHALRICGDRRGGLLRRFIPILTSVVIQAVRGIPVLAMALESRGLGRKSLRTELRTLKKGKDLAIALCAAALLIALLLAPLAIPF